MHNWHIEYISAHLEQIISGNNKRLIINLPPRSLKSIIVSIAWPAWILGHNPSAKIIVASYAQDLAEKLSLDCRSIIESAWYKKLFPEVKLSRTQNSKNKFMTSMGGFRIATSVGASIIGEGADYIIVDDPQSARHAASRKYRENVIGWFEGALISRLNNKAIGSVVLVMQRLHENDLTGHLTSGKSLWQHIRIPAISEQNSHLICGNFQHHLKEGDILCSARESLITLENLKQEIGSLAFEAQYQQNPLPREGGIIKLGWFAKYRSYPADSMIVQSWDTGVKAYDSADPSCCTVWGVSDNYFYLLDVFCQRLEYPDLKRTCVALAEKWQPSALLIEDKSSGQSLLQDINRETRLPAIPIKPRQDKITRLSGALGILESGRVKLPDNAPWMADFIKEIAAFPNGVHDDQVDSMSQFLGWIREKNAREIMVRRI